MEMPEIEWPEWFPGEPQNKEFLAYKESCINDVLSRLRVYVDTLCSLQGLRGRDDVRDVIWFCLREFVAHFWDLPASRDFHHNGRWGLLCHSLDVAFRRAESASQHIAIDKQGKPSAEAAWKNRTEGVLVAFITGFFHDCGKIFDVRVIYKPFKFEPGEGEKGLRVFHPLMGGLLGFKLKHPEKYLQYEWKKNRGMRHVRLNPGMFVILMQQVAVRVMQSLDHEQIIDLFESLIADGDEADAESVADYRKEEDENYIGKAVQLLANDGFKAKDRNGNYSIRVFYLGHNTYAFIHPLVVQSLAKYINKDLKNTSYDKDAVLNYLINNEYIYCSQGDTSSGKYFLKETFYMNENEITSYISFVNGRVFDSVDVTGIPMIKLKHDEGVVERLKDIFGCEPPMSWFAGFDDSTEDVQSNLVSKNPQHAETGSENSENAEDSVEGSAENIEIADVTGDYAEHSGQDEPGAESGVGHGESEADTEAPEEKSAGDEQPAPENSDDSDQEASQDSENVSGAEAAPGEKVPSHIALENLLSGLQSGEYVLNDPEDEKNLGFI